jgi:hypothetical protein
MGRNSGIPYDEIHAERWLDIKGWQGYQVSDLGRVRHWDSGAWWMLKQNCMKRKKQYVVLSNGRHFTVMVDRLVMEAFVGARRGRWIIHVNHIIEDNALENLQYANRKAYLQWMKDHWKAIGRTKCAEHRVAIVKRREQHHQRNNGAARRWLSGELTLKAAASTIGISESALSVWIKRHNLKKEYEDG